MTHMRSIVVGLFASCILHATVALAGERYDFRKSDAYTKLSKEDRAKLEQVHRDLMMLWGALDRYADSHDGNPPEVLTQLVPDFLGKLPTDPFATVETAEQKGTKPDETSKDGWGYRYRRGSPGNRAWTLASVGLRGFPYLAAQGNVDLYICKGVWISGMNPVLLKEKKPRNKADAGDGK